MSAHWGEDWSFCMSVTGT